MNTSPRGGYDRGAKPARPGDLAARTAEQQRHEAEAQKRVQTGDPYASGFGAGWNRGFDAGFDGGYEVALKQLTDAGIDTDAVLGLVAEDEN